MWPRSIQLESDHPKRILMSGNNNISETGHMITLGKIETKSTFQPNSNHIDLKGKR